MISEKDIIHQYKGTGKLTILESGKELDIDIELTIYLNTEIVITLKSKNISAFNIGLIDKLKCSFLGVLEGNKRIFIPDAAINNTNLSMTQSKGSRITLSLLPLSDIFVWDKAYAKYEEIFNKKCEIIVGLINFTFEGRYMTQHQNGHYQRDTFKFNIKNSEFIIKQLDNYKEIKTILKEKKNTMLTSDLSVKDSIFDKNFQDNILDILMLFSFSQKTLISKYYTKFLDNGNELMMIYHNDKKYPYSNSDSLIDSRHLGNNDIEEFIESVFDRYQNIKKKLKMQILIDIICNAEIARVLESKYLLLITSLELAIEQYRNEIGVDIEEDEDLIDGIQKCISNYTSNNDVELSKESIEELSIKLSHKTFKKKVKGVIDALNLTYSDPEIKRIKENRNKIVHELRFKDYKNPLQDYLLIRMLVDKIVLKILDYDGYVLNYLNNYNREKIF